MSEDATLEYARLRKSYAVLSVSKWFALTLFARRELAPKCCLNCGMRRRSQRLERASNADAGVFGRVQIDFGSGYVRMPQQILDVADADAARQ